MSPPHALSVPILAAPTDDELRTLIGLAFRRADIPQKAAAFDAGVDAATWCKALHGEQRFDVSWLWRQSPAFWREFLPLLRAAKEDSDEAAIRARKERLIRAFELLVEVA